jgi:hypothetical protein
MISDVVEALQARLQRRRWSDDVNAAYHRRTDLLVPIWTAPSQAPERRHEAGAGNPTDAPRWKGKRKMGDGVTSAGNGTANQTNNAGNSGAQSAADDAAQSKFGEALKQESLCPPGLGRPPHMGSFPPRYDPKCHYLRDPSGPSQPSKPADLQVHGDIPNLLKGPTNDPNGPDYKKSIPAERDPNPLHGTAPPATIASMCANCIAGAV